MAYDNNKKEDFRPNTYSPIKFSNLDSEVEKSNLSFTFWKGLLKISIAPLKPSNDGSILPDYKKESSIYLSPSLAYMAYNQIQKFISGNYDNNCVRTKTSDGILKISKGEDYGTENAILTIEQAKSKEDIVLGHIYEFKQKEYYGIDNFSEEGFKFDKHYYENLEIDFLMIMLKSFYESSTYAIAHSVVDNNRFNNKYNSNKLNSIAEAVGVEYKSGYKKSNNKPSAFDDNSSYNNTSYDDIENQFE